MTEQMNVPKLRFGEFEGKWKKVTLGELMTFKNGINASKEQYGSGVKFINVMDIIENDFITHDRIIGSVNVSDKEFEKNVVEYGDLLFQRSSETREDVGQTNVYLDEANVATFGGFVIRGKKIGEFDSVCLNYLLKTSKARKEITTRSGGSTRYNVGQATLSSVEIFPPSNPKEQQKIASFLSKVDEKIGLLSEKKDKLTEYKRGVMQQLFNGKWHEQDGLLTFVPPSLRFKADDGSEFPDWEEKKFSDCFEFFTTNSLSRDKLSYTSGEVKNIHYGDIHTKFRTVFLVTQESVPSIAEAVDTKKIKTQSYCQDGDLVFADASEDYADIGKCIEIRGLGDIKLVSGLHTHLARPKEKFALGYQAYLQKSWKMRYQIMRIAQGTKVLGISTKQLAQIDVPIPCYDEQEKIASLMMALDSKIELLNFEINKAKEWKKGLLQQMFV